MPRLQRARTRRDDALREGLEVVSPNSDAKLEILELPPRGSGDPLRVKRVLKPNMGEAPPHVHLDFAEEFEVKSGVADAKLDDLELRLTAQPGRAKLYVPAGVPHVNPYNRDIVDLVVVQSFQPATEGARSYIRTLAEMFRDGRDDDGELPWSLVLAIGHATRDRTYFSRVPFSFQRRVLLPLGNVVAGTRGYSVYLPREPRA